MTINQLECDECRADYDSRPYEDLSGELSRNAGPSLASDKGEELVTLTDHRGVTCLALYAVPKGTDNPQDAIHCRRVAYWSQDGKYGEWILVSGEPSGVTDRDWARYVGEAY